MKKAFVLSFLLLTAFVLAACSETIHAANAIITIDINPSVEITTNASGRVSSVTPLNDDAQILLLDTNFKGKVAIDVILEITELARKFGYLKANTENAVVITTNMDDEAQMNQFQSRIRNRIQAYLSEKQIPIDVIDGNAGIVQADIDAAQSLGISVGKYRIIKTAMSLDVELTYEAAIEMSIKDLLTIIQTNRESLQDFASDHVRIAYLQLRSNAKAAFHSMRVTYIETQATGMLLINPSGFDGLLVNSDLDAQGLVDLYSAYVDALEAIEIPSGESYEDAIQAKLDLDAEITAKNDLLLGYRAEFKNIYEQYNNNQNPRTNLRNQAQLVFMNFMETKLELDALVKAYVDAENIPHDYVFFYQNGNLEIILLENFMDDYREVRETYRQLFLEHQVDLAAFEALFVGNMTLQLQTMLQQYQQVLNQFKLQMVQITIEARLGFRYEHMIRQQTQQDSE